MAKKTRTPHRLRQIEEATHRRVAIYLRRSTDEDNQPYSLEAQETKLRAFVQSQPGDWQIVKVYSDDASGASTDRDELQKMLRAARAGLFDTVLVYRVDRFSRRLRDLVGLLDELADMGVVFRSATEPFDTSTPVGRMLVQMLGVFAEFEREVIIDRVINGMERKAEKGLWNGGARPLGYVVDKATQRLVIDQAEATTVRLIFDSYTKDRLGTQSIATMLNSRGLRTRLGKPWSQHTVEHIITNRVYIGEKRFGDIAVADAHPAIIQPDQFDLAQRILGKRSADIGQRAANPSEYELTGRIRCPQCGRRYVGAAAHGRNNRYRYYVCWSRARYGTQAGCDNHRFNADELEKAMRQAVMEFYSTGYDVIVRAVTEYQASHAKSSSANRDQLAAVVKQLKDNSSAVDRYLEAFERGSLDGEDDNIKARLATLRDQARQLRTRKIQLEAELEQPPTAPQPAALSKIRTRIREIFDHGNHIARKALFEALIEEIVINSDDSLTPIFKIPVFRDGQEPDLQGPALDQIRTADAVRALLPMVGDTGIEPVTSSV